MYDFFPNISVIPQNFQDQAISRQEAEAEPAHPTVDPHENRQQDQVRWFLEF